jgi:hypothetical protein
VIDAGEPVLVTLSLAKELSPLVENVLDGAIVNHNSGEAKV